MLQNTKKRIIRRRFFNWFIRFKSKHLDGLFDVDKNGYFVK